MCVQVAGEGGVLPLLCPRGLALEEIFHRSINGKTAVSQVFPVVLQDWFSLELVRQTERSLPRRQGLPSVPRRQNLCLPFVVHVASQ